MMSGLSRRDGRFRGSSNSGASIALGASTSFGGIAVVGMASALIGLWAPSASAQNLIANDSFEYYENPLDRVWSVTPGSTPTHYQNKFLWFTPRCDDALGLEYESGSGHLDGVSQTRTVIYPDTGMYLAYADIAGDRSKAVAPWTTQLMFQATGATTVTKRLSAPVPALAGPLNTDVRNATFFARLDLFPMQIPSGSSVQFTLRDDDDRGVIVDNVHFFPLSINECMDGQPLGLAGFSVEGDYWSPTTGNNPVADLLHGTSANCFAPIQCDDQSDTKGVWMWSNECDCRTQIMIAGYSFAAAPTSVKLHMEIEGLPQLGSLPGYTVQFYDWAARKWVSPPEWPNLSKPFPGGRVASGPSCHTVDWSGTGYAGMPPLSVYTAGLNHNGQRIVLARVTFGTCGEWGLKCPQPWPAPPCSQWVLKLHHAHIECF